VRRILGASDGVADATGAGDAAVVADPVLCPRSWGPRRSRWCRAPRRGRSAAHCKNRRPSHAGCRRASYSACCPISYKTCCRAESAAARWRAAVYAADSTRAAEALPTG
jgi:hypothetical protein